MKAARWWPVAILLLGVTVLGTSGAPNKEGYRLAPYRPVLRFRHKVFIVIPVFHLGLQLLISFFLHDVGQAVNKLFPCILTCSLL